MGGNRCKCVVADCKNKPYQNPNSDLRFFAVPTKPPELVKKWLQLCQREKAFNDSRHSSRICDVHFVEDDFERDLRNELLGLPPRRRLKKDACPSIFPGRKCQSGAGEAEINAKKARIEKRNWVKERKAIVAELLKQREEEVKKENDEKIACKVALETGQAYFELKIDNLESRSENQHHDPPISGAKSVTGLRQLMPGSASVEEPSYFDLTRDDLLGKIDAMWTLLRYKNKKVLRLRKEKQELKNRLKNILNKLNRSKSNPLNSSAEQTEDGRIEIPVKGGRRPLITRTVDIETTTEQSTIRKDAKGRKPVSELEKDIEDFCTYNRKHLKTMRLTLEDKQKLKLECITKIPKLEVKKMTIDNNTVKKMQRRLKRYIRIRQRKEILKPPPPKKLFKCDLCEESFSEYRLKVVHRREKHRGRKKLCPHCNLMFPEGAKFKIHLISHSTERPFLCNLCGNTYKTQHSLKRHIARFHEKSDTPCICTFCGKVCKNLGMLQHHERIQHKNTDKYTCPICHKVIAQIHRHIDQVHRNIRNMQCHLCGNYYKNRSYLNQHLIGVHKLSRQDIQESKLHSESREGNVEPNSDATEANEKINNDFLSSELTSL